MTTLKYWINDFTIFRRPAILRASGHTFEYLGYGPGNYSTGFPQVQIKSLTEREDFLAQSQERSGGLVVYTGMNNNGDVFNGNFVLKNFAVTKIRTHNSPTLFFFVAAATSRQALASSWSRMVGPFYVASTNGGLAAAAIPIV